MKRTIIAALVSSAFVTLVVWGTAGRRRMPSLPVVHADGRSIVGTWIATITVNGANGAPPFVFTDIFAINSGGTLTTTSTAFNAHTSENPFLPAALVVDASEGYGVWEPGAGPNEYRDTFKRFLFAGANTSMALYPSLFAGQNVGTETVEAVATLQTGEHGETLSGQFTTQLTNLGGEVVFAGDGTFSATRLKLEPLAH